MPTAMLRRGDPMGGAELNPDGQKVAKVARREGGEVDASMLLLRVALTIRKKIFMIILFWGAGLEIHSQ